MTKEFRPDPSEKRYTFDDVQGIEEAKDEVKELVEFLRNPEKFQRLGAKLPTGRWKNGYQDIRGRCIFWWWRAICESFLCENLNSAKLRVFSAKCYDN